MPQIAIEAPADLFTISDWQELMDQADPAGPDVLSLASGEATLVGQIPANKARTALSFFLGYSYADNTFPFKLHRVQPARHPMWPWLYVTSAQFHRHNPAGSALNVNNQASVPAIDPYKITKTGRYQKIWVQLHFEPLPYVTFDDNDPIFLGPQYSGAEWARNCDIYKESSPNLETLNATVGRYLKFFEGPPGLAVPPKDFPGTINEYKISTNLVVSWKNVPEDYVFDTFLYATKIVPRIGTVNRNTFFGCPPGTLLLLPPKYSKYVQPIRTNFGFNQFGYDVDFNFGLFDPKPGVAVPYFRGWQLMPWVENATPGTNGGVSWLGVKRPDGSAYLPNSEFADLFKHWSAP
jgi:hypothetical protein